MTLSLSVDGVTLRFGGGLDGGDYVCH